MSGASIGASAADAAIDLSVTSLSTTTSGDGAQYIRELDSVALGTLSAGIGTISLTAVSGAITEQFTGTDVNIIAGEAILAAGTTIGTAETGAIDLTLSSTLSSTSTGNVFLRETNETSIKSINAGAGNVTLTSGGAITDGDGTTTCLLYTSPSPRD